MQKNPQKMNEEEMRMLFRSALTDREIHFAGMQSPALAK